MTTTETPDTSTARLVDDAVGAQVTAYAGDAELSGGVVTIHRPNDQELPAGDALARRYRVTIADGAWDRARIEAHLAGTDW